MQIQSLRANAPDFRPFTPEPPTREPTPVVHRLAEGRKWTGNWEIVETWRTGLQLSFAPSDVPSSVESNVPTTSDSTSPALQSAPAASNPCAERVNTTTNIIPSLEGVFDCLEAALEIAKHRTEAFAVRYPEFNNWQPWRDPLVPTNQMPPHLLKREQGLKWGYELLVVGAEREFRTLRALHDGDTQWGFRPFGSPAMIAYDGSGNTTPTLNTSGFNTPLEKTVLTPPIKPEDQDILWITVPRKRPAFTRSNAIRRSARSSVGVEVLGKELMPELDA